MTLPLSYSRLGLHARSLRRFAFDAAIKPASPFPSHSVCPSTPSGRSGHSTRPAMSEARRAESNGGEGRIRTFEAAGATDLQSVAFDRFATSPKICLIGFRVFDAYCVCRCLCFCQCLLRFAAVTTIAIFCASSGLELAKGFEPPTC